jgi:hypothetical protein
MNDLGERLRRAGDLVSLPDEPFERLVRRRDRRRRRERVTAVLVSVALVLGGLGGALFALSRTNGRFGHGSTTNGGRTSHRLSAALRARLELGAGQYLYIRERIQRTHGAPVVLQTWWATDGSGRIAEDCPAPCDYGTQTGTFGVGLFPTDSDVSGLSTDPNVLYGQMLERTGAGGSSPEPEFSPGPELTPGVTAGSLQDAVGNLLQDPNGSPELRAALYEVATRIPNVTITEGSTDPAGRAATRFDFPDIPDGGHDVWYFDPTTKQLMAVAYSSHPGEGLVFDEGIVPSTDAPPSGDQWLYPPAPSSAR